MRALRAVAVLLLAVSCTCGEKKTPTEPVGPEGRAPPIDLKPLPQAPQLSVEQEPLPGSEALAVVAARPQGPARGEVRPTVTFSKPVKSLAQVEEQRASDKAAP